MDGGVAVESGYYNFPPVRLLPELSWMALGGMSQFPMLWFPPYLIEEIIDLSQVALVKLMRKGNATSYLG